MAHPEHFPNPTDYVTLQNQQLTHAEIFSVVDNFYRKVAVDPALSIPFRSVHDWPEHIQRMTHFWWIRFGGKPYLFTEYNPVAKHFFAGFNKTFLGIWLELFRETLNEKLQPAQADIWRAVSEAMGQGLLLRNELFERAQGPSKPKS
jgi:hemoglobin